MDLILCSCVDSVVPLRFELRSRPNLGLTNYKFVALTTMLQDRRYHTDIDAFRFSSENQPRFRLDMECL